MIKVLTSKYVPGGVSHSRYSVDLHLECGHVERRRMTNSMDVPTRVRSCAKCKADTDRWPEHKPDWEPAA